MPRPEQAHHQQKTHVVYLFFVSAHHLMFRESNVTSISTTGMVNLVLQCLRKEAAFLSPKVDIVVLKDILVVWTGQQDGSFLHRKQCDLEHVNEEQYATNDGKYQCLVDEMDECHGCDRQHDCAEYY